MQAGVGSTSILRLCREVGMGPCHLGSGMCTAPLHIPPLGPPPPPPPGEVITEMYGTTPPLPTPPPPS